MPLALVGFVLVSVPYGPTCSVGQVALLEALRLRWSERKLLEGERERLLAELKPEPAAASAAQSVAQVAPQAAPLHAAAPAPAPAPAAAAADGFITNRNAPAPAAAALGNVPHAAAANVAAANAAGAPSVRGVCPGCQRNVLSNDEGRVREGEVYFHTDCIKGYCGGCGKVVHKEALRTKRIGLYWHDQCAAGQ
jgi:hypothetical protein